MTDYDYASDNVLGWTFYRCVCGIVTTGVCPRCKESDRDE